MKTFHSKLLLSLIVWLPIFGHTYDHPKPCCQQTVTIHPSTVGQAWEENFTGEEHLQEKYNSHVLHLLDHNHNVFLFRGSLPEHKKIFTHDGLTKAIKDYLSELNLSISDNFKIMDISFLNYLVESENIEAEKSWFEKNPDTGSFWLHPLYGALVNPIDMPKPVRDFYIRHHDIDGQKALIKQLREFLSTPCDSDTVYYIHCHAGKDRTGECSANYMMANGHSYKESVAMSENIAKRKLSTLSMNAIRWYAFYLRDIKEKSWIGDID